jgi:S1-C subfamily serine protease
VGTGFVAGPGLILTCAHVAAAAGGGPGEAITIIFHHNGEQRAALVDPQAWRPPEEDDLALLRFQGELPAGVSPVPLAKAEGSARHPFRSFGYPPVGAVEGLWAEGTIQGLVREAGRPLLQLSSQDIARGSSGGPVLDEARGCVVGIVHQVHHPDGTGKHRDTAFAISLESVFFIVPGLTETLAGNSLPAYGFSFFTGGAVPSDLFVGRKTSLALIRSRLGGRSLQSISIVGERRIGKSSLLRYTAEYATHLFPPPSVVIYLDLMKGYNHTRAGFAKALRRELG